ncbi:unnamed protein product [Didymodactylos carnosus]|uniref:Protein kinase domain-containing protein n=1 Tax=Didymodactylos carnosus TaxID=1234261 RepID=A0A8S2NSF0_9BILA|nr:unnamed protein product [Didymodactylos carnosus]CAF4016290.1 unnamed protein product [Didymodactylos carnosus]
MDTCVKQMNMMSIKNLRMINEKLSPRLPPIQMINDALPITDHGKNRIRGTLINEKMPFSTDIDAVGATHSFYESSPPEILLLDTYPPRNWNAPYSSASKQGLNRRLESSSHTLDARFDLPFPLNNPEIDFSELESFPSPISDRLPSSHRFYGQNVTSACSRRSSILFQRVERCDELKPQRENTFDTVCESVSESVLEVNRVPSSSRRRPSPYTVLPPITDEPLSFRSHHSNLLSQSFNENEIESSRLRKSPRILKSLDSESKQNIHSISPPLVTIDSSQNRKDDFVRRILSRSLSRESSLLVRESDMSEPTTNTELIAKEDLVIPQTQTKNTKSAKVNTTKPSSTPKAVPQAKSTRSSDLKISTVSKSVVTPIIKSKTPLKIPKPLDRLKPEIRDRVLNPEILAHLEAENRSRRNSSCPVLAISVDGLISSQEKSNDETSVVPSSAAIEKNLNPLTKVRRTASQHASTTTTRTGKFMLNIFQPQSKTKTTITDPLVVQKTVCQKAKNVTNCATQECQQSKVMQKKSSEHVASEPQVTKTGNSLPVSSTPPPSVVKSEMTNILVAAPIDPQCTEQNIVQIGSPIDMMPGKAIPANDVDCPCMKEMDLKQTDRIHQRAFRLDRIYPQRIGPVPKPLTLQGEKSTDADCSCNNHATSTVFNGQRRTSLTSAILNSQPHITDLFENFETNSALNNPSNPLKVTKRMVTVTKQRPRTTTKSAKKTLKNVQKTPPKVLKKVAKDKGEKQVVAVYADIDHSQSEQKKDNLIIVGGNNWMTEIKQQKVVDDSENNLEEIENQLVYEVTNLISPPFNDNDIPIVEEEDLPSIYSYDNQTRASSPEDHFAISQTTAQTIDETHECEVPDEVNKNSISREIVNIPPSEQRRSSIESIQSIEFNPVIQEAIEKTAIQIHNSIRKTSLKSNEPLNSDIRTVYENVQDSVKKDTSLRPLYKVEPSHIEIPNEPTTDHIQSEMHYNSNLNNATSSLAASLSYTRTTDTNQSLSFRPGIRVVGDSLNSRGGSETMSSNSSNEDHDYSATLLQDNDTDEIYRMAKKGKTVGHGAYGTVWSYLTLTGRMIAVKEIELDESNSERVREDYESVREEVNILRGLDHPYIVKFLGISLEETHLVKIFMEYLPNGTIEHLLQLFGPFHVDVLKKYTRQIVEGVAYLHENNVVHRDIKGKNIMLDINGNIKLIDFGCAKRLKKNQNTHSVRQILKSMKGTANWMAPEVISETGHGKKADIWSIGCTMCEMATGKPPWSEYQNQLAVLLIIGNGTRPPAELPDSCPLTAKNFFKSCLTRDPKLRPSAKELLLHAFLT